MIWPVPLIHFFIAMLQLIRMNSKHAFVAFMAYSFLHSCFAEEVDVRPPEKWPVTVNATVSDIISQLSEEDKKVIRDTPREDLIGFHHGWGTGIRNYYGLWRGNEALILDACGKPCHPDTASVKIIEAVWRRLMVE